MQKTLSDYVVEMLNSIGEFVVYFEVEYFGLKIRFEEGITVDDYFYILLENWWYTSLMQEVAHMDSTSYDVKFIFEEDQIFAEIVFIENLPSDNDDEVCSIDEILNEKLLLIIEQRIGKSVEDIEDIIGNVEYDGQFSKIELFYDHELIPLTGEDIRYIQYLFIEQFKLWMKDFGVDDLSDINVVMEDDREFTFNVVRLIELKVN